jgi:hypothetical protein
VIIDPDSYARNAEHHTIANNVMASAGVRAEDVVEIWVAQGMCCIRRLKLIEDGEPFMVLVVYTKHGWQEIDDTGQLGDLLGITEEMDQAPGLLPLERPRRRLRALPATLDVTHPARSHF